MTELEWMIQPYERKNMVYNTDRNEDDVENFFRIVECRTRSNNNKLENIFNGVSPYVISMLMVAKKHGIKCYLKKPGRNNNDQTMPFLGVYFGKFGQEEHKGNGQPNIAAGGKILGIDISEETINFQLSQFDTEDSAPKILEDYKDKFNVIRGALRIRLTESNVEAINTCLSLTMQSLKKEFNSA